MPGFDRGFLRCWPVPALFLHQDMGHSPGFVVGIAKEPTLPGAKVFAKPFRSLCPSHAEAG